MWGINSLPEQSVLNRSEVACKVEGNYSLGEDMPGKSWNRGCEREESCEGWQ